MNVGDSVRLAINDWASRNELESAMLHACNAVDGTAKKLFPNSKNKYRFTTLLRNKYHIVGPMGLPNINIEETRFPVNVHQPTAKGGPDLADLVYGIHRCCHAHGDELPDGFELIPNLKGPIGFTQLKFKKGKAQLSDRIIAALLAVAVLSPVNKDQRALSDQYLSYEDNYFLINDWWGREADFSEFLSRQKLISVKLDFRHWMQQE